MRVTCINDKGRPNEIPLSKWVKEGQDYTIINVEKMLMMPGVYGVELAEIDLSDCFPHTRFNSNRFAPKEPEFDLAEELENILTEDLELVN